MGSDAEKTLVELTLQVSALSDVAAQIVSWIRMAEASGKVDLGTWEASGVAVDKLKIRAELEPLENTIREMKSANRTENPIFQVLMNRIAHLNHELSRMNGGDA